MMMSLKEFFGAKSSRLQSACQRERLGFRPFEWLQSGCSRPKFKHLACLGEIQLDSIPAAVDVDKEI